MLKLVGRVDKDLGLVTAGLNATFKCAKGSGTDGEGRGASRKSSREGGGDAKVFGVHVMLTNISFFDRQKSA